MHTYFVRDKVHMAFLFTIHIHRITEVKISN